MITGTIGGIVGGALLSKASIPGMTAGGLFGASAGHLFDHHRKWNLAIISLKDFDNELKRIQSDADKRGGQFNCP